jgi:hypothetical protein
MPPRRVFYGSRCRKIAGADIVVGWQAAFCRNASRKSQCGSGDLRGNRVTGGMGPGFQGYRGVGIFRSTGHCFFCGLSIFCALTVDSVLTQHWPSGVLS